MGNEKQGVNGSFDNATEREIRLEEAKTKRIHAEEKRRRSEERRKSRKKATSFLARLPLKVKIVLSAIVTVVLIGFFGFALPYLMDDHETQYLSETSLKSAVDIDSLSTVEFVYRGVAERHSQFLWQDQVDYRVKYEAHIPASYTLSDIEFSIDEENKVITAYLPEATIGEPQLDHNKFGFLPESVSADMKDVIALCREDAALDVDVDEIKREAEVSLQDTVNALTMPLLGGEYSLEFAPASEYDDGSDTVE